MSRSIKLVYFDVRGRGEFIRLVLEAAGQKYDEERLQFIDWYQHKDSTPYGSLPYIVYNGKTYGQSGAIASFLARELGFYGKTNLDGLRIEEVHGLWEDQFDNCVKYFMAPEGPEKEEFKKKVLEEEAPKFFGYYERMLSENGGTGFLVGDKLSLGDFYIYDMQDNVRSIDKDVLKNFPLNQKLRQNVESDPKLKVYLEKRNAAAKAKK